MECLKGEALEEAKRWMAETENVARQAGCHRSKSGAIIVKDGAIIGRGYNSPPNNDESQRRCHIKKDSYNIKVTDKTCCVHGEERAIMDALKNNPEKLEGARLYYIRLSMEDEKKFAGKPYCTICSKMALDSGIAEFSLWHKEGICVYNMKEYNDISFDYDE